MDVVIGNGQQRISAEKRLLAPRTFKQAMKLVGPMPKRAAECEQLLYHAIAMMTLAEWIANLPRPAEMREIIKARVRTLRTLENDSLLAKLYREQTLAERQRLEKQADRIKRGARHGSRPVNFARFNAVHFAYHLLADFNSKGAPGLTRGGLWHDLAQILFGHTKADLFDYMKIYSDLPEIPAAEVLTPWVYSKLLAQRISDRTL